MKKYAFTILVITILLLPFNTTAAICNQEALEKARNDAYKLKFSYEIKKKYDEETTSDVYYYQINVEGLTKEIYVVGDQNYTYGTNPSNPTSATFELDYDGGATIFMPRIKASEYNDCYGETVYTPTMKLAAYNIYYNSEECLEYPGFKYCKENYEGTTPTKEEFDEELDKYIEESKEEPSKPSDDNKKETYIDKIISYINDHKVIFISSTITLVAIIAIITTIKINKRKKRIKINLEV